MKFTYVLTAWAAVLAATVNGQTTIGSLPFTAAAPGSYILTGNLTVSGNGITVAADNVSIDGQGFSITGDGTGNGVACTLFDGLSVTNLTVDNFDTGFKWQTVQDAVVTNNTISNCTAGGMDFDRVYNPLITGNTITGNGATALEMTTAGSPGNVSGNIITNNGTTTSHWAISLVSAASYLIDGNTLTGNTRGINVQTGGNHTVSNNDITGGSSGIVLNPRGDGGHHNVLIEWNTVTAAAYGLQLNSPGNTIRNNIVINGTVGVNTPKEDNDFDDNVVDGHSDYGLRINNSANITFDNNSFSNNGIYGAYISGLACTNLLFNGNAFDGNGTGGILNQDGPVSSQFINGSISNNGTTFNHYAVRLQGESDGNTYAGNTITGNSDAGLWFVTISTRVPENNLVYNNYFNNPRSFLNSGTVGANIWDVTPTAGPNIIGCPLIAGNYWADAGGTGHSETCTDGDANGICDTPLTLNGSNVDNAPLTGCGVPCASFQTALLASVCGDADVQAASSLADFDAAVGELIAALLAGADISDATESECAAALLAYLHTL